MENRKADVKEWMEVTHGTGPGSLGSRGSRSPWANAKSHQTMAKSIQEQRNAEVKMRRECCHFRSTMVVKTSWRNRPWKAIMSSLHLLSNNMLYNNMWVNLNICLDQSWFVHPTCSRIFLWATLHEPFLVMKRALCDFGRMRLGCAASSASRVNRNPSGKRPLRANIMTIGGWLVLHAT